jgi:hypothetical protein
VCGVDQEGVEMSVFAVFSRDGRVMHAVSEVAQGATRCGLPTGVGSGLVRDGVYGRGPVCSRCWSREARVAGERAFRGVS